MTAIAGTCDRVSALGGQSDRSNARTVEAERRAAEPPCDADDEGVHDAEDDRLDALAPSPRAEDEVVEEEAEHQDREPERRQVAARSDTSARADALVQVRHSAHDCARSAASRSR